MKDEIFGTRIKKFRKQTGMTQEQFAQKIGVSKNFLGDVERQKKKMSFSSIVQMIDRLALTPEWLIYFVYGIQIDKNTGLTHPLHLIIDSFDAEDKNQIYAAVF